MFSKLLESTKQVFSPSETVTIEITAIVVPEYTLPALSSSYAELSKRSTLDLELNKDVTLAPKGNNAFDQLPDDIKILILSYLSVTELYKAACVSNHWKSLTSLNYLWKPFLVLSGNKFDPSKTNKEKYQDERTRWDEITQKYTSLLKPKFQLIGYPKSLAFMNAMPNIINNHHNNNSHLRHAVKLEQWKTGGNEENPSQRFIIKK